MPHPTILYAEDDPLVLRLIEETLALEGWRVRTCRDGRAALALLAAAEPYDLLLCDNELPGVDGLELVRYARTLQHGRHLPILMLSASPCRAAALTAGSDEFLSKPAGMQLLVATVNHLLSAAAQTENKEDYRNERLSSHA